MATKKWTIGPLEAAALVIAGIALALVIVGGLDPVALVILLVLGYVAYIARGVLQQAARFRPVEPRGTWRITLVANLALMILGIGAFGWYLAGAGAKAWVPFLVFIAGMMALRAWRRDVVARLYSWRTPALTLLQKGEYRKLIRELEDDATAGHPDKLAMVALAYIELNKLDRADRLLIQAQALAPDFASVNGAVGMLRRHQGRYGDAVAAIRDALAFEENINSRYYLGLCQFLDGDLDAARVTLEPIMGAPDLIRQGQVVGAYILGRAAEAGGDSGAARTWYDRMAEGAPPVLTALRDEARRHKQTSYGDTLKAHIQDMDKILAQRPLTKHEDMT
ncbi:MAG: tetratricopeptide repeat protein [Anaerolineae bacterium]|nr:tetratricopeptide repeat protein [Anaerolineae bacterium]